MAFRNTVNYDLGTMDAANEYTPMILVEDFETVAITALAASSANATIKFYASDSEARPDLGAAASATNIFTAIEVFNADT